MAVVQSDNEGDTDLLCNIHTLGPKRAKPYTVVLELNGHAVSLEIDTGAAVSLISEQDQRRLFPAAVLDKSDIQLRTYTGKPIPVLGQMRVSVKYNDYQGQHILFVVKGNGPAILGREWISKIKLDWVNINSVSESKSVEGLCDKYTEVFQSGPGVMTHFKAHLTLKQNARPVFRRPYSIPFAIKDRVGKELDRLEEQGVLRRVDYSDWASPVVPDLTSAYQQMELDSKSSKLVTINTHKGLYEFLRLPFGVSSAPALFQRTMDSILQGLPFVICYLDDILVSGRTTEEHLANLEEVFRRLKHHGIRLKKEKCSFFQLSVEYLGHQINAEGVHTSKKKVQAILEQRSPRNISELRSFLGMLNFYAKFLPNLSSLLHPLHLLLRESQRWNWTIDCEKAFQSAKEKLAQAPVLAHYDPDLPLVLSADASAYGVGAVIAHRLPDGSEQPIAYASRTLTNSEVNYAQIEKEALSLIFGVKKFHHYLYGRHFVLITDHKPLLSILGPKRGIPPLAAARMQRWALILSAYTYKIEFRPTTKHGNADGLSRLPLPDSFPVGNSIEPTIFNISQLGRLPVTAEEVAAATRLDPTLKTLRQHLQKGWPNKIDEPLVPFWRRREGLSLERDCILWGCRVIIPAKLRGKVLEELHDSHPGIVRMKSLARSHVWYVARDR